MEKETRGITLTGIMKPHCRNNSLRDIKTVLLNFYKTIDGSFYFWLLLVSYAASTIAVCCRPLYVGRPVGHQANPICLDGNPLEGFFCGKKECNVFGCNCEEGCLEAKPEVCYQRRLQSSYRDLGSCRSVCNINQGRFALPQGDP